VYPEFKENFFIVNKSIMSHSEYSRDGQLVRGYISRDRRKLEEYRQKFEGLRLTAVPVDKFYLGTLESRDLSHNPDGRADG
jgi:hypothetical protein